MTLPSERRLPWLFLILLLAVVALGAWQWRDGAPLSANLMELVPGTHPDALELRAEQRMQEPLNRDMLVLVGHTDRQQAVTMAQTLGEQWQASGLFEKVQWNLQADLPAPARPRIAGCDRFFHVPVSAPGKAKAPAGPLRKQSG